MKIQGPAESRSTVTLLTIARSEQVRSEDIEIYREGWARSVEGERAIERTVQSAA